jgi:tRNA(Arg) A34 adenosine deaminase TadA
MCKQPNQIAFHIPAWVNRFALAYSSSTNIEGRMSFVVAAAKQNVTERTGGPFAAAVFERDSGKLISLGVNLVTAEGLSVLHAEIVAITVAQKILGTYDLGREGLLPYELVSSAEPCAMCYGAILWAGVRRLVTGARGPDVRSIGFDEGPMIPNWRRELEKRGIETICDVKREAAMSVLSQYAREGGIIYNARASRPPAL